MFDFLKGGKYKLDIAVDGEAKRYFPGETISIKVNLETSKALNVKKGQLLLYRKETYQTKKKEVVHYDENFQEERDVFSWKESEKIIAQEDFLPETVINGQHMVTVPLTIPEQAMPTYNGKIVKVSWFVRAIVGRKNRFDLDAVAHLDVGLSELPRVITRNRGSSTKPKDVALSFELADTNWVLTEPLSGQLIVQPHKDFDVNEVRIELIRNETVSGKPKNVYHQPFTGASQGEMQLKKDVPFTLPFQVLVAWPRMPTYQSKHYAITWTLKATLFRAWRQDTYLEDELVIMP